MALNWFENVEWRQHPWPGLNWLTASLLYADVRAAIDFYTEAMGFVMTFELPAEDSRLSFARMRYRGANFTLNSADFETGLQAPGKGADQEQSNFLFYLYVDDVRLTMARMVERGAKVVYTPTIEFWGDIRARLTDPFGYVWDLAQRVEPRENSHSQSF